MSSKVTFQVHYGDFYRITHDSYGVNLSALERRQCSLDKPLERSFESIRKCLHRKFNVNPKTHLVTVHTLTSWQTNGDFWELTHISITEEWQHYMHIALESGWPLAMVIQIDQKTGDLGEVLLIHTVYRACPGGQPLCCELSSALEHVSGHSFTAFLFCVLTVLS